MMGGDVDGACLAVGRVAREESFKVVMGHGQKQV